MILGTVELGLDYGVNNNDGKPSYKQAFDLLDAAWNNGIRELDTAAAYGNSEEIIGNYQKETGHSFLVDTKLPVMIAPELYEESLDSACARLYVESLNLLYLHSFEQCKDDRILDFLKRKKEKGKVRHVGISIYEPQELKYIVDNLSFVDTVQFPFNILDSHRWQKDGLLKQAKQSGKRMYARSVFLQGLVFKSPADGFVKSVNAEKYINAIGSIAKKNECSIVEMAYKYVSQTEEVDDIIVGCQSVEDVIMNVTMMNSGKKISSDMRMELDNMSKSISTQIIDPRKWRTT